MKKLIAVFLIFALLPIVAVAEDSDVIGCWSTYLIITTGTPLLTMLYIAEDHTCYFTAQYFYSDSPAIGRAYVGTWEIRDEDYLVAKTGDDTETVLYLSPSRDSAIETSTGRLFVNISEFIKEEP